MFVFLVSSIDASLTISHSTLSPSSLMPHTPLENTVSTRDQEMNTFIMRTFSKSMLMSVTNSKIASSTAKVLSITEKGTSHYPPSSICPDSVLSGTVTTKTPIGGVIGGTFAAVFLLAMVITIVSTAAAFFLLKYRKKHQITSNQKRY